MKIELQQVSPSQIETRSMQIIATELTEHSFTAEQLPVAMRVIHTSADFEYAKNLVFSKDAISVGVDMIKQGCIIVTDTQMARAGINKRVLEKFGGEVMCFMSDLDVADEAKSRGVTRAAVSMERAANLTRPVILALGNAPTAVIRACELIHEGFTPKLVIGVPVGFVNVVESKELLLTAPVEHIVAKGRKGGSNIAAAICNALIYIASENARE